MQSVTSRIPPTDKAPTTNPPKRPVRGRPTWLLLLGVTAAVLAPTPAYAVIPGLAPGLAALLPQLFALAVLTLSVVFSPRAWWNGFRACLRRPFRTLVVTGAVFIVYLMGSALVRNVTPRPGAPLAARTNGYPTGDARASGLDANGRGPFAPPTLDVTELDETVAPNRSLCWDAFVLLETRERNRLIAYARESLERAWSVDFDGNIVGKPFPFERAGNRRLHNARAGLLVVTAAEDSGDVELLTRRGSALSLTTLDSPPQLATLVDDVLLVVSDRSVTGFRLHHRLREEWQVARAPRAALDIAGDNSGHYYLLDANGMHIGHLDGQPLERAVDLDGEQPVDLAVRAERVAILSTRNLAGAASSQLRLYDPALRTVLWERSLGADATHVSFAPFGIVVAFSQHVTVHDPSDGSRRQRWNVGAPIRGVPRVTRHSCFTLSDDGRVHRFAPAFSAPRWGHDLGDALGRVRDELFPDTDLIVAGTRLWLTQADRVAQLNDEIRDVAAPGGHWRLDARRSGAQGTELPLQIAVAWRQELSTQLDSRAGGVAMLPFASGWLLGYDDEFVTYLQFLSHDGEHFELERLDGRCCGLVRQGDRVFCATQTASDASVYAYTVQLAEDAELPAAPRLLWHQPLETLSSEHVLCAADDLLVVCLEASTVGLAASSGTRLWESTRVAGGAAPLVSGGRVVVVGRDPEQNAAAVVQLVAPNGEWVWTRPLDGHLGAPAVSEQGVVLTTRRDDGQPECVQLQFESGRIDARYPSDEIGKTRNPKTRNPKTQGPGERSTERQRQNGDAVEERDATLLTTLVTPEGSILCRDVTGFQRLDSRGGDRLQRLPAASTGISAGLSSGDIAPAAATLGAYLIAVEGTLRCVDSESLQVVWEIALPGLQRVESLTLNGERILVVGGSTALCLAPPDSIPR